MAHLVAVVGDDPPYDELIARAVELGGHRAWRPPSAEAFRSALDRGRKLDLLILDLSDPRQAYELDQWLLARDPAVPVLYRQGCLPFHPQFIRRHEGRDHCNFPLNPEDLQERARALLTWRDARRRG